MKPVPSDVAISPSCPPGGAVGRQRGCAVPADRNAGTAYPTAGISPPGRHELGQLRSLNRPDAGNPQIHPLDLLAGQVLQGEEPAQRVDAVHDLPAELAAVEHAGPPGGHHPQRMLARFFLRSMYAYCQACWTASFA